MAIIGIVMLIACANVGNSGARRSEARQQESRRRWRWVGAAGSRGGWSSLVLSVLGAHAGTALAMPACVY
jgi:hypothetical protein